MITYIVDINKYCMKIRLDMFKETIVDITLHNASIRSRHAEDVYIFFHCPFSLQIRKSYPDLQIRI